MQMPSWLMTGIVISTHPLLRPAGLRRSAGRRPSEDGAGEVSTCWSLQGHTQHWSRAGPQP